MRTLAPFLVLCIVFMAANAQAAETARQREQRSAEQKQLALRFDEINRKLDSLNVKGPTNFQGSTLKEENQRELGRLQDEMRKLRETAGRKMTQVASATGPEFDRLKAEANTAIEDLNRMYEQMSSLLKRAQ